GRDEGREGGKEGGTDYVGPLALPPRHDVVAAHALSLLLLILARVPVYQSRIWAEATAKGVFPSSSSSTSISTSSSSSSSSESTKEEGETEGGSTPAASSALGRLHYTDVQALPFTVALLNETLRLFPPHSTIIRRTPCAMSIDLPSSLPPSLPLNLDLSTSTPRPPALPQTPSALRTPRSSRPTTPSLFTPSHARGLQRGFSHLPPVHTLPPGTNLTLCLLGLHTDGRFYTSPFSFLPERWLEGKEEEEEEGGRDGGVKEECPQVVEKSSSASNSSSKEGDKEEEGEGGVAPTRLSLPPLSLSAIEEGLSGGVRGGEDEEEGEGEDEEYQRFVQVKVLTAVLLVVQHYKVGRVGKEGGREEERGVEEWVGDYLKGKYRIWKVTLTPRRVR
ncbi:Hypothetical protein NocV09_07500050, partial [Nannochloropsis oceanica]